MKFGMQVYRMLPKCRYVNPKTNYFVNLLFYADTNECVFPLNVK